MFRSREFRREEWPVCCIIPAMKGLVSDQQMIWSCMKALDDESQLTIAACQGSVEAFEALVLYYEPRIRRMLYSLTQDQHLTQDLCQETFLAAYRAMPRMKGEGPHF